MTTTMEAGLDAVQRERLARLADALIPGGGGLPVASEAATHTKWIDRALAVRPDFLPVLRRVLSMPGDPAGVLEHLQAHFPDLFEEFTAAVSGAYLLSPRVRRALGYPGPAPKQRPPLPDEADVYLEDGILDCVIERGPIYRPTPEC